MSNWIVSEKIRRAAVSLLTGRRAPKWLKMKYAGKRSTSLWLAYDAIRFTPDTGQVELLADGVSVAAVGVVEKIPPGGSLTVTGLEGRTEVRVLP